MNRAYINDLAKQRIQRLFALAVEKVHTDPALADRYVEIALRISMRTRVRIPREIKRNLCKGCDSLLYPGITSRVRIRRSRSTHLSVTCLKCGFVRRFCLTKRR